jgi:uncharacterized protein YceK
MNLRLLSLARQNLSSDVRNMKMKNIVTFLVLVCLCSGCATATCRIPGVNLTGAVREDMAAGPYPAVQMNAGIVGFCATEGGGGGTGWMTVLSLGTMIDLPFSFVFDTLCLPYDLWMYHRDRKKKGH